MTNLKQKQQFIEECKSTYTKQKTAINTLRSDIEKDNASLSDIQAQYKTLIMNNEHDKADKLFSQIEALQSKIRAKQNRLKVMEHAMFDVTLEVDKKMNSVLLNIHKDFYDENKALIDEYEEAKQKLKEIEAEMEKVNSQSRQYNHQCAVFVQNMYRENDIDDRSRKTSGYGGVPFTVKE